MWQWTPAELCHICTTGLCNLSGPGMDSTGSKSLFAQRFRARSAQRPAHRDRVSHDQRLAVMEWKVGRRTVQDPRLFVSTCILHRGRAALCRKNGDARFPRLRRRAALQLRNSTRPLLEECYWQTLGIYPALCFEDAADHDGSARGTTARGTKPVSTTLERKPRSDVPAG